MNQQIITEQLLVETEDHRRIVIDASEVLSVIKKSSKDSTESSRPSAKVSPKRDESPPVAKQDTLVTGNDSGAVENKGSQKTKPESREQSEGGQRRGRKRGDRGGGQGGGGGGTKK